MSDEDYLLSQDNQLFYYRNKALSIINIFKLEGEEIFPAWVNKFEYIINLIEIPSSKKIELFFTMVDNEIHIGVKRAYPSVNFSELSYEDLIYNYLRFFSLSNEINFQRSRFICRNQHEKETIENYVNSLQTIYNKCNFGIDQEKVLRERFFNGIHDDDIRDYLNKTSGLSFDEMVAKAIAFEKANAVTDYLNLAISMIPIYNQEHEEVFYAWLNKFEYVMDVIGVPDKKKVKFFNEMIDNNVHNIVKQNYFSVQFSKLSYENIISYYLRYFDSSYKNDLHRKRFMCRNQYEQETIENYANSLRQIYNKCNFEIDQEKVLCEQFVNGIRENDTRIHLNKTPGLSFDEMVTKAIEFDEVNDISNYLKSALSMIPIYNLEYEEAFFAWLNKFEYVSDAVGVPDKKKIIFFNKMVDNDVHVGVKRIFFFVKFSEITYEDIISYYLRYFDSSYKNDLHMKRFMFRNQYEQETIENYANSLRKIYNKCNYAINQEKELCERFVNGISNDNIKIHLNKTPGLSFDEMVTKAIEFDEVNDISDYLNSAISMISIYNLEQEEVFYAWLNKFEYVADVVGVPDKKMVTFFNEMVDNHVHDKVKQYYFPTNFLKLSYEDIINYYLRYFSSSCGNDGNKKRFMCRNQYEEETISKYAENLRKIYNKCNFKNRLKERLCEKFRNGIRNVDIRAHLIRSPRLSLEEAVALSISLEKLFAK